MLSPIPVPAVLKDGAIAKNLQNGLVSKLTYPFRPSGMGVAGAAGDYTAMGRQAAHLGIGTSLYNFDNLQNAWVNREKSKYIGRQLDAIMAPINDHSINADHRDTTPAQPAPTANQTTDKNQQQPTDLTQDTPGLG
jgi:hypothetical protein